MHSEALIAVAWIHKMILADSVTYVCSSLRTKQREKKDYRKSPPQASFN